MSSSYEGWSEDDLKAECEKRGLKNAGGTETLIARLETFDEAKRRYSEGGAKKRGRDEDGRTQEEKNEALLVACMEGTLEEVRTALDEGAKKNAMDGKKVSALMRACTRDDDWDVAEAIVHELLKRGALCDLQDIEGRTALHWAASCSSAAVVALLVEAKAPVNSLNATGETPLIICCRNRMDEEGVAIARILLQNGANIEHKNLKGSDALTLACEYSSAAMVELLLTYKADVNIADNDRTTPLMAACNNTYAGEAIIPLLIVAGADAQCKDIDGDTALNYAFGGGGAMMRAISHYIAPKDQLKNCLPHHECTDPIGSIREAAAYGVLPSGFGFEVRDEGRIILLGHVESESALLGLVA